MFIIKLLGNFSDRTSIYCLLSNAWRHKTCNIVFMIYKITLPTKRMKSKANIERNAIRGYCEVDYSVLSRMKIVLTGGLLSDFPYRIASKLDFDGGNHSVLTCRWFGGALYMPTIKLSKTVLNKPLFTLLRDSLMQNSFFGLIAYYLNQSANRD